MCVMSHTSEASILMSHVACINAPIRPRVAVCCSVLQCVAVCLPALDIGMGYVTSMNESCRTHEWVMSYIWISHGTYMNGSCYTYVSHVTHMNESCHTYEWVMFFIWMSHGTHMNGSRYTYVSHVTHMNESCHTYEWVMSFIWMSHGTHMNGSRYTYVVMPNI